MKTPLFSNVETSSSYLERDQDRATLGGIISKTFILVLITSAIAITVSILLVKILEYNPVTFFGVLIASMIFSLIFAIVGRLSDKAARVCSVGYALTEGVLVGTITGIVEAYVSGAGIICTFATLIIFLSVLGLYAVGFLKSDKIFNIIGRLMISFLLIGLILALFTGIVYYFGNIESDLFPLIILIEVVFLAYGIFSLTMSFGEANYVIQSGCSKNSEWQVALGMEISLVYIYIRMLRLLLIIAEKRR